MMPHRSLPWRVAALLLVVLGATAAQGAEPTYRVLKRPPPTVRTEPQVRAGYAYGWFGAPPRKHPERHFGYHRRYTQWSWK